MDDVAEALRLHTWAVVGCSPDPGRASHAVASFLRQRGYQVVPVNPTQAGTEILGQRVRASLHDLEEPPDVVDVFRRSERAAAHVEEAIAVGAKAVWLQLGVTVDDATQARARAGGLLFVQDRCPRIELR